MQVKVAGTGPALVLLHGWGMRAKVWDELTMHLARQFCVHSVDLPGHGGSPACVPYTLDAIAAALADCTPRATVCGWSLGGQLALRWALMNPAQVERLVLIASTPRFVRCPGWENGMQPDVFDEYAREVARDKDGALLRFALLQAHGDTQARKVSRRLREFLSTNRTDAAALAGGLQILEDTDLRGELSSVTQSVLILHGERDVVVPVTAAEYLERALPRATLQVIEGAAHAPFIGREHDIARRVAEFCHG